ncbi:MAG: 3-dehydroquinate synthase [Bdellovibrionaceae bacterium]|nr:3-dehydroquinate synthase [Pseudobdellovibrionaceae bacterium]
MDKELKGPFNEKIILTQNLSLKFFELPHTLFFVDENLKHHPALKSIEQKGSVIYLEAGEELKSLASMQRVLLEVQHRTKDLKPPYVFVAIGGGTMGDFCGFLSSVYHRGVKFIQCPTTWLAAVDSAHGGKNALNVDYIKNQIGTFYPASQILIAKSLLKDLAVETAMGEVLKTILLSPPQSGLRSVLEAQTSITGKWLWEHLPEFIKIKNEIVKKDPYEKSGERFVLNFGHTVGHAVENLTGLSHSDSVLWGLLFSLRWSVSKKYISSKLLEQVYDLLYRHGFDLSAMPKFSKVEYMSALVKDKKRRSHNLHFVLYQKDKAIIEPVTIGNIIGQLAKQGFVAP